MAGSIGLINLLIKIILVIVTIGLSTTTARFIRQGGVNEPLILNQPPPPRQPNMKVKSDLYHNYFWSNVLNRDAPFAAQIAYLRSSQTTQSTPILAGDHRFFIDGNNLSSTTTLGPVADYTLSATTSAPVANCTQSKTTYVSVANSLSQTIYSQTYVLVCNSLLFFILITIIMISLLRKIDEESPRSMKI